MPTSFRWARTYARLPRRPSRQKFVDPAGSSSPSKRTNRSRGPGGAVVGPEVADRTGLGVVVGPDHDRGPRPREVPHDVPEATGHPLEPPGGELAAQAFRQPPRCGRPGGPGSEPQLGADVGERAPGVEPVPRRCRRRARRAAAGRGDEGQHDEAEDPGGPAEGQARAGLRPRRTTSWPVSSMPIRAATSWIACSKASSSKDRTSPEVSSKR